MSNNFNNLESFNQSKLNSWCFRLLFTQINNN